MNISKKMIVLESASPCSVEDEKCSFFSCTDVLNKINFSTILSLSQSWDGRWESCFLSLWVKGAVFCLILVTVFSRANSRKCSPALSASSLVVSVFCISGFTLSSSLRFKSSLNVFLSVSSRQITWSKTILV